MKKRINKPIIIAVIIILLLTGYYIYYKNSEIYQEFETISNTEELLPYENETKEEQKEDEIDEETSKKIEENNTKKIVVHITGEVKNVGVVELEYGARIIDAVNKAGGFTEQADLQKVNLAYVISDGIMIYIPNKNEVENREYITTAGGDNVIVEESEMKKSNNELININKATQTELETLPGIGPSIAMKIISYREGNGKFSNVEDLKNVSGIGENKFESIKELICI